MEGMRDETFGRQGVKVKKVRRPNPPRCQPLNLKRLHNYPQCAHTHTQDWAGSSKCSLHAYEGPTKQTSAIGCNLRNDQMNWNDKNQNCSVHARGR